MKELFLLSLIIILFPYKSMANACLVQNSSPIDELLPLIETSKKFNCNEPNKPLQSPNKEYFEKLLAVGINAPLEDFLKFWDPAVKEYENDPYFFSCQEKPYRPMTKLDKKKLLAQECRPDVLYTWGKKRKLDTMINSMPDGKKWKPRPNSFILTDPYSEKAGIEGALFMALTPVVSFGYGDILVRVKVKENIDFVPMDYKSKTKIAFSTKNIHEFVINRSHMIESWSFGTPEIYDELVRDIKRHLSNQRAESLTSITEEEGVKGLGILYAENGMDGTIFTEEALKKNLLKLIEMILKDEGKVIFHKDACRNYEEHYRTSKSTWFNPN